MTDPDLTVQHAPEGHERDIGAPTDRPLRVLTVASGKGGVGKTNITANLAVALAHHGQRVCVFDTNFGLPNLDILLGFVGTRSVIDVLRGELHLADVATESLGGIHIIPAPSGFARIGALTHEQQLCLLSEVDALDGRFDVLLIDTATGTSPNVLYFAAGAADALIVITSEMTSIANAYSLLKELSMRYGRRDFLVVVSMATGARDAKASFDRLARLADRFLRVRLEYQGFVPHDDAVVHAVREQRPVVLTAPDAAASVAFVGLAKRLLARRLPAPTGGLQFVYPRLIASGRG